MHRLNLQCLSVIFVREIFAFQSCFYYEGLGVEKDLEKALYWTRRAAEHGDRDGQYNLAEFYEDAIGVERDIEQAKHWYRLAALQNDDLAIEKCKELGIAL